MRRPILIATATAGLLLHVVTPALLADWLVTRQGARLETRGPWTVKGRLVVFATATGQLASLRADEVDLAASAIATSEALAPPVEEPKPEVRAVLILTDADVEHVDPGELEASPPAGPPAPSQDSPEPQPSATAETQLRVASWEQAAAGGGIEILGKLLNPTTSTATAMRLGVVVFDASGKQLARGNATIDASALPSGQDATFRIVFPEIAQFTSIRFLPEATLFKASPTPPLTARPEGQALPQPEAEGDGSGGNGAEVGVGSES